MAAVRWAANRREATVREYVDSYASGAVQTWTKYPDPSIIAVVKASRHAQYSTALSLGSGNGINEYKIAKTGIDVICIDLQRRPLEELQNRYGAENNALPGKIIPVQSDMTNLGISGTFDIVLAMKVFQHFSFIEQKEFIAQIKAYVNKGGIALISASMELSEERRMLRQRKFFLENFRHWQTLFSGINDEPAQDGEAVKRKIVCVAAKRA